MPGANRILRWVWFGLIIFFVLFSLYPTWYEITRRGDLRPNRYFELIHNFPTDYNFYLSRIRQGIEGRWTVVEKYTSEPHQGSYMHIFYLAMGWVGGWNRVPWERAGDVYNMGRIVLAVLLLALTVQLAKHSFNKFPWQVLGFLLAVTASTWPKIVQEWDGWRFGGYMPWWSVMDSLQRITFLPHLLFGQSLILFLLIALSNRETMGKPYNWIFLGIIGFVMGIVFPPGILFVYTTIVIIIILEIFYEHREQRELRDLRLKKIIGWAIRYVLPRGIFILLSAPSLLYLMLMTSFYPWKRLAELDVIQPLPFKYDEYLLAVGPILPIGVIGLMIALWRRDRKMILNIAWVTAWAALLIIFKSIPQQSPLRFSEMIPHVPLGMLVAYLFYSFFMKVSDRSVWSFFSDAPRKTLLVHGASGIEASFTPSFIEGLNETSPTNILQSFIFSFGRSFRALQKANPRDRFKRYALSLQAKIFSPSQKVKSHSLLGSSLQLVFLVLPVLLVLLNLGIMHSSWLWQRDFVDHKIRAEFPLVPTGSYVMYPLKDFIGAMKFIQDASRRSDVILTETTAGNYMPVYSGNTVYVGHDNTVNAAEKKALVSAFYRGQMPVADAREWMASENFRFVYYGPQEREENNWNKKLDITYPFLRPVYENEFVTVYENKIK